MINRSGNQVCVERRSSSLGRTDIPALNFTTARAATAATSWQPATSGNARRTRLFINYFFLERKKNIFFLYPRQCTCARGCTMRVFMRKNNKRKNRGKCAESTRRSEIGKKTITHFTPFRFIPRTLSDRAVGYQSTICARRYKNRDGTTTTINHVRIELGNTTGAQSVIERLKNWPTSILEKYKLLNVNFLAL